MPGTAVGIQKARAKLAQARAERAARARLQREGGPRTFGEAFDTVFADWFSGPTWRPWRVVGKAIFGEPLDADELETFREFTGRTLPPTTQAREVWLLVGRRAGKDWFSAAVVVFLACYRPPRLKVGDLGRVLLLACDQDQASECYRYISELIDSVPELAAMVTGRATKPSMRITLDNRIEILVKPADRRRVRGRTVLAVVASEVAFWWDDETNANPAIEDLRALRPSMLGVPGAMLIAVTSPYGRRGLAWETFEQHYAKDGDRVLVVNASTMRMRPDKSDAFLSFLEEEQRADPVAFASEYGAEFRRDLEDYIGREQVAAVIAKGRSVVPPSPGTTFVAFLDPAGGGGQDSAALAVATHAGGKAVLARVVEWRPPFSPTAVAAEVAGILREYRVARLRGDNFSGATWADILKVAGVLRYDVEPRAKSDLYRDLVPALNGGLVELLDPEAGPAQGRAVSQLLALERRASRRGRDLIAHPRNGHDDVVNAVSGALLLALEGSRSWGSIAWHDTRTFGRPTTGPERAGAVYLGNDTFRATRTGEVFTDARGV
jgi:hypothetical protein